MARRTKEDALTTRHNLLDAAELLFQAQGVSRTSLNEIARHAGTSRGAIYWHFKDKSDLFNAMMERVTLPLEKAFDEVGKDVLRQPLAHIREVVFDALRQIETDLQIRRVFEVASQKVEYIDELHAVTQRHLKVRNGFLAKMKDCLIQAALVQKLNLPIPAEQAANGLHALVDGMIQNWLLDTGAYKLRQSGELVIDIYLKGLGFSINVSPD